MCAARRCQQENPCGLALPHGGGEKTAGRDVFSGARARPEPPQSVPGGTLECGVGRGEAPGRGAPLANKRRCIVLTHQLQPVPLVAYDVKFKCTQLRLELLQPQEVAVAQVLPVEEQHRQVLLHQGVPSALRSGSLTRRSRGRAPRPLPRSGGGLWLLLRSEPPRWLPVERQNKSHQRAAIWEVGWRCAPR